MIEMQKRRTPKRKPPKATKKQNMIAFLLLRTLGAFAIVGTWNGGKGLNGALLEAFFYLSEHIYILHEQGSHASDWLQAVLLP